MAIDKNAVTKEAQKFAAKGQFDKAIAEWKKLVKESPNDATVFNTIGDLCLKKDAKADAVDAYSRAAGILASDGFTSKAIALYKKVLNIDPKKIEAHLSLADLNAEKGLTGNALESYKRVADHYTAHGEMGKALAIYQKMADLNASNVAFRLKLADMYAKEGMKKEAVQAYLQAADVHLSKDAFNDARQVFEKALALDPNNKEVYHKAGIVYFKEGKFVEACKALKPVFEEDPSNKEVADLYLDALAKAGRATEAEEAYKKLLSQDAGRADLRLKLYELYRASKDYDKALVEASTIARDQLEKKEFDAAETMLKSFVAAAPRHAGVRRLLGDVYKTIGKATDAAAEFVQAGDILAESGDHDGAKIAFEKALELEPGREEAKERLDRLQSPPAPVAEVVQPPVEKPAAPAPALEEDPAVAEAFTEVDVLVKYGLSSKAIDQLESLAKKFPESVQVRAKLRDLYGDQGNMGKAAAHLIALSDIYSRKGMADLADSALRAAQELDPGNAEIQGRLGVEPSVPPVVPVEPSSSITQELILESGEPAFGEVMTPPEELSSDLDFAPPELGEELSIPGFTDEGPSTEEQLAAEELGEQPLGEELAMQPLEEDVAKPEAHAAPAAEELDISEVWAEAEFYYQQGLFEEAKKHYQKILEHQPEDRETIARLAEISQKAEETQEFSKLAEAVDDLEGLAGTGETDGEMASSASDDEAVRALMQEIAQLKQKPEPEQPAVEKAAAPAPEPETPPSPAQTRLTEETTGYEIKSAADRNEEDFFDLGEELREAGSPARFSPPEAKKTEQPSDDFFDLASELRDELSGVDAPSSPVAAEEQSLDDIFEEFKKGVEQQAVKEDADTHYNLGVAYKEMGLLDDAIGEFIMTVEEEPKYAQSRYMLGLCYLEQGNYQHAISEIQSSLTYSEGMGGEVADFLGMHYELGLAYQGAGNTEEALREFQSVYDRDPDYRDVAAKIQELQQGEFVSLEQLKDDIEREISSKFLEEGERIEREEKIKKNEKVRN